MENNTARFLLASLLRDPQAPAIGDLDHTLSRVELIANVSAQAHAMLAAGLREGDFCFVLCDRGLRFWIELLAAWTIGCKPVCVEANIGEAHAASALSMTNARFVCADGMAGTIPPVLGDLTIVPSTFDPSQTTDSILACFESLPFAQTHDDLAGLIFTSGTTGIPKGVPLTHTVLAMNALATAHRLRLRPADRLLIATPFRFISSISHFLVTLISGASFFGLEKPMMIKDLIDGLNSLDISAFGGSPFHVQFLAMAGSKRLPKLRWIMSSGDHLRPAVIEQLEQSFDAIELHVVYGMAELGGRFCELPPEHQFSKKGSVGFPINGYEFVILDENSVPVPQGEIGEIHVRGPLGFSGYYKNPEANQKVLGPNGFRNGDKGYLDEDGYLYLSGRSDSVFKRSGLKVSAQVVEAAIMDLEAVSDVFVTGQSDQYEGMVPVAYICWKGGHSLDIGDLSKALRPVLPVNHLPKAITALDEIPRTGSGKVDRRKLAQKLERSND